MYTLISKNLLILLLIISLGAFLRFFLLAEFPVQLNHDEISQLYDGISIAHTGKDIYGNFLPTIMPSVNDFKSPFYTYATALTYLLLGDHEWIIRVPGALFGTLTIIAAYLLILRLLNNRNIAILSAFFVSISPSEIFFSRKSFENMAGIFFMTMAFYFLLTYLEKLIKRKFLYLGITFLAAGMYTYFSHAIIIPLMLITFIFIFRDTFLIAKRKYILPLSFWILLLIPIILIILTNPVSRYRSQTVFITQDINLGKQIEYGNRLKSIFDFSFNRYLDQYNPKYIFGDGLDFTNQGFLDSGMLLLVQLPLVVMGIIYLIRLLNFGKQKQFILAWILLGMLPSGLTFEQHSPHRSIMVFTMLNMISGIGLYWFIKLFSNLKYFLAIIFIFVFLLAFNFVYFIHIYFVNFPFEKSQYIQYPFKRIALYAWSQYQNFDRIIFDPQFGDIEPMIGVGAHYYFGYYGHVPPTIFQKEYHIGSKPREVIFDKFSIRQVYWPADKDLMNTLVIASPWSLPIQSIDKDKMLKTFYFYNGKIAFYAIKP